MFSDTSSRVHGSAGAGLTSRKLGTDDIAEEEGARSTSLLLELRLEGLGNGVGTRVDVTGEEDGETLLLLRGVRFTENLDDSLVREPIGNGLRGRTNQISQLGSRQSGSSEFQLTAPVLSRRRSSVPEMSAVTVPLGISSTGM